MSKFEKKSYEPIPEGDYLVRMNNYEVVKTKKGDDMVKASFEVVNGDFKKRLVFENFLLTHSNEKVAKIGKERLSKLLKACGEEGGFEAINLDATRLENYLELPFLAVVSVKKEETYTKPDGTTATSSPRNTIKAFKKR